MTFLGFSYCASFSFVKLMGPPSYHRVEYLVEGHLRSLDGLPSYRYIFADHDLSHSRPTRRDLLIAFATLVTRDHHATINHEDRGVIVVDDFSDKGSDAVPVFSPMVLDPLPSYLHTIQIFLTMQCRLQGSVVWRLRPFFKLGIHFGKHEIE